MRLRVIIIGEKTADLYVVTGVEIVVLSGRLVDGMDGVNSGRLVVYSRQWSVEFGPFVNERCSVEMPASSCSSSQLIH